MGFFLKKINNKKYFDEPPSRGFMALYVGKAITLIASGLLGIFLPIFLYNLFDQNFRYVVLFFGIGYLLYMLSIAGAMQFLNKFGFRRSLRLSVFVGALVYALFFFLEKDTMFFIIPSIILVTVAYRSLYWLPYHIDFAKFTNTKNRGRQLSSLSATRLAIGSLAPLFAGFIVAQFGFDVLFIMAIILYLASGIPYLKIPRTKEVFIWSYRETWRQFFSHSRHKVLFAYVADGAESVVGLIVWPIFIFELLKGDFLAIGILSTLIVSITVFLQLFVGKYMDMKIKKETFLKFGSFFYAVGWIIKIFVVTAFDIFFAGLYHSVAKIFTRTSFDALTYEMSADEGHYVDEFTALKEMALHGGKFLMAMLVILVSFFFALQWVFILAAVASLSLNFIRARDVHLNSI